MATYRTTSPIDFTKTVVISFDTNHSPNNFDFGVGICNIDYEVIENEEGEIIEEKEVINLSGGVKLQDYNHIDFDDDIYSQKENIITFSLISSKENLFSKGYIIQKSENETDGINYYDDKTINSTNIEVESLIFEKNDDDFLCLNLSSGLKKVKEDTVIFEKIDDYTNLKENLVVQNNEVFKENKDSEIITFVLDLEDDSILSLGQRTYKENISDETTYLKDLDLLALDYCMTKNLKEESILYISRIPKSEDANPSSDDGSIIKNSPFDKNQRIRFVISNNGRLMNISLYDKEKKIYNDYLSFTFEKKIEKGYLEVYTNSSSNPSNVSTNF